MSYLFLIGNGLNRQIDNDSFKIETGMKYAWNKIEDDDLRKFIYESIDEEREPVTEDDLEKIQEQVFTVTKIQESMNDLKPKLRASIANPINTFTINYYYYLFDIAKYYHDFELNKLPEDSVSQFKLFGKNFINFLNSKDDGKCHVATLNYDKLLYDLFFDNNLLKGFDGKFVDGFFNSGFSPDNLERRYNNFGWYLHLHGSPLFYDNDGNIHKSSVTTNIESDKENRKHIVLCSQQHKESIIRNSRVLNCYHEFFKRAIKESINIIIIGYSGNDYHINQAINHYHNDNTNFFIIENQHYKSNVNWYDEFGIRKNKISIPKLDSIFQFDFSLL